MITIATPTFESDKKDLMEDPGTKLGQEAINDHIHLYNTIDGVQGELAGDETYKSSPKTQNVEINVDDYYKNSQIIPDPINPGLTSKCDDVMGAHSFDVENPSSIENTNIEKLKSTIQKQ